MPQEAALHRRKPDMTGKALALRVVLRKSDPEVWRLVQVPAEMTLADLSGVFEAVMGWHGVHLHRFHADSSTYWTPPKPEGDLDGFEDDSLFRMYGDDSLVRVGDVLYGRLMKLQWDYDLGDYWQHDVSVESINYIEDGAVLPLCVGGGGACPPEGFGGIEYYAHIVKIFADESHLLHDEVVGWFDEGFDPHQFDAEMAALRLGNLRKPAESLRAGDG